MNTTTNFTYVFLGLFILFSCSSDLNKISNIQTLKTAKMSSIILKIISTNPSYIPNKEKLENGKIFLEHLFKGNKIEFVATDTIEFVDQGENFESVSCNFCGHTLEIETWQNLMDNAHKTQFKDLSFITSC